MRSDNFRIEISVFLYVCVSICLSVYMYICLSAYLSIYLSVNFFSFNMLFKYGNFPNSAFKNQPRTRGQASNGLLQVHPLLLQACSALEHKLFCLPNILILLIFSNTKLSAIVSAGLVIPQWTVV